MDAYRIHDMLEDVSEAASTELAKGTESVNTKEFGDVVDMIKDLTEAEKNKAEACYYNTLVDAMENAEYGQDYDEYGPMERRGYGRMGYNTQGSRGSRMGMGRRNYPMNDRMYQEDMYGRQGYSRNNYSSNNTSSPGSRYGYSYDNYMNNRRNYSTTDPEDKQERMKMMQEYSSDLVGSISKIMEDVSPEEKQMLKSNLTKVMNNM